MKHTVSISFLIILFLTISCLSGKERKDVEEKILIEELDIRQLSEYNLFSYKRPIDNCRFVVLETTDESLIKEIEKVYINDDLIFIKDTNDNLFLFNMFGQFLNKIGSIGQGVEELLSFYDFYVNEKNEYVGIFDILRNRILRFSFEGKFISKHSCTKEMNESHNFLGLIDNDLLIGMRNNKDNKYAFITVNENDYSLENNFFPFSIVGRVSSTPLRSISSHSSNGLYVTNYFSDTIFEFSANKVPDPILIVKSDLKTASSNILSDINSIDLESVFEANAILRRKGFSTGINNLYATDSFLKINYPLSDYQSTDIFYCIKTGKAYKSVTNRRDFFGQSWRSALTTTDKEIVYAIEAETVIELKNKSDLFVDEKVIETIKNVDEYDNPILVFFSSGYKTD